MSDRSPILASARRELLAAAALATLLGAPRPVRAATPPPVSFRILRSGSQIGTHRVSFSEAADGSLAALTEVDIVVKLAGITVYRFGHRFREELLGGRLRGLTSRQDRNGRVGEMTVRAEAGGLQVQGPEGALRLPAEALPLSWWDVTRIEAGRPLFDNATGQPLRLNWTRIAMPDGSRRWRCTGDRESEGVWAADGRWIGWTTKGDDGSTVTYERG